MRGQLQLKKIEISWTPSIIRDLKILAMGGYPNEVCGIIHEHGIIHQYPNTFCGDHSLGFDMEIDIHDPSIRAIWHSHPKGLTTPSRDDLPCMETMISHGFNYPWIIVTPTLVTEWIGLLY
jgi:proteasome lid subunit RPN8/RPN11